MCFSLSPLSLSPVSLSFSPYCVFIGVFVLIQIIMLSLSPNFIQICHKFHSQIIGANKLLTIEVLALKLTNVQLSYNNDYFYFSLCRKVNLSRLPREESSSEEPERPFPRFLGKYIIMLRLTMLLIHLDFQEKRVAQRNQNDPFQDFQVNILQEQG